MASPNPEPMLVANEDQLAVVAAMLAGRHSHDTANLRLRQLANWAKEAIEAGDDPLGNL